jgi:hypothetical protein
VARIKKPRPGDTSEAARALRVAMYTRVSSEMQLEGYSLESQLDICREYTAKKAGRKRPSTPTKAKAHERPTAHSSRPWCATASSANSTS